MELLKLKTEDVRVLDLQQKMDANYGVVIAGAISLCLGVVIFGAIQLMGMFAAVTIGAAIPTDNMTATEKADFNEIREKNISNLVLMSIIPTFLIIGGIIGIIAGFAMG